MLKLTVVRSLRLRISKDFARRVGPSQEAGMIDWDHVRELRDEIGADAFEEVVEMFLDEVETEIAKLRAPPDGLDLEAQLHFIKGSALNLGFSEFSQLCQGGEALAAGGGSDTVNLGEILASFERSKAAFLADLGAEVATG
jgi:hypothetical protein